VTPQGIQLIAGLGNPGSQYARTRHNVGAWYLEQLAKQHDTSLTNNSKLHGAVAKITVEQQSVYLFQPSTFMNDSGRALVAVAHYYKIPPNRILVAHDELDHPVGSARLKYAGGHGGHNGLRSIIQHLGSHDFYRLRLGIAHPGNKNQVTNHVLKPPSQDDEISINRAIDDALRITEKLTAGEFEKAFHQLHSED
jgi:peptidyl-tRNA hydrolase